jgi:hypothetical protein
MSLAALTPYGPARQIAAPPSYDKIARVKGDRYFKMNLPGGMFPVKLILIHGKAVFQFPLF